MRALLCVQMSTVRSSNPSARSARSPRSESIRGVASSLEAIRRATLDALAARVEIRSADRVLVPLLDLERLAGEARTAVATLPLLSLRLALGFGRWRLAQPGERGLHIRGTEHATRRLPLLVIEEPGRPKEQRIGKPEPRTPGEAG